ncbi:putative manganese efflux pump MntP [Campylobacterota bacterium]|nr:putative manganese efflux pump MntP [Campylobacterota bacterium]
MGLLEIILIAIGLSMDAFAVSITLGLSVKKPKLKEIFIPGIYFGLFQALMPVIGYFLGFYFAGMIQSMDHWIAFILLGLIGGKMVKDGLSKEQGEEDRSGYAFGYIRMVILAFATSIDAFAVGVTFAFFEVNIVMAAVIIGTATFFISIGGVIIGNIFGAKLKSKAELVGGVTLILIGVKILLEHLYTQSA